MWRVVEVGGVGLCEYLVLEVVDHGRMKGWGYGYIEGGSRGPRACGRDSLTGGRVLMAGGAAEGGRWEVGEWGHWIEDGGVRGSEAVEFS